MSNLSAFPDTIRIRRETETFDGSGTPTVTLEAIATVHGRVEQPIPGVDEQRLRGGSDEVRVEYIITCMPTDNAVRPRDRISWGDREAWVTRVYMSNPRRLTIFADTIAPTG